MNLLTKTTTVLLALSLGLASSALFPVWGAQCNITATPLAFGNYDTLSTTPLDSTASLNISCKPKKPFTVTVQFSPGSSGSFSQRSMSGPGTLLYNLFTDASMTNIMGDGTGGSSTLQRIVDKANPWNLTIFGRIPALQTVPAGIYADSLTATILF